MDFILNLKIDYFSYFQEKINKLIMHKSVFKIFVHKISAYIYVFFHECKFLTKKMLISYHKSL